jgi:hypothetical protein
MRVSAMRARKMFSVTDRMAVPPAAITPEGAPAKAPSHGVTLMRSPAASPPIKAVADAAISQEDIRSGKKYDDAIERNGFATVLYLRLVYFPFTPMNFGMGLTKVRFWDYFFGTGMGIIVGTFILTFFIGTLKKVWASGNWGNLISFKVFLSVALFILSLFVPKIIAIFRKEKV